MVVLEIWDEIYPDIDLDEEDRRDTGVKLMYLVCLLYAHDPWLQLQYYVSRLEIFFMTGVPPLGQVP